MQKGYTVTRTTWVPARKNTISITHADSNNQDIDTETRKAIAMVSSIINIFAAQNIPITDALITDAYAWSSSEKLPLGPLSESDGRRLVAELTGLSL